MLLKCIHCCMCRWLKASGEVSLFLVRKGCERLQETSLDKA